MADTEVWGLRTALRGWRLEDPGGAPAYDVPRTWTGFRTARFEHAVTSRVPTLHVRSRVRLPLDPSALEPTVHAGLQGEQRRGFVHLAHEDPRGKPRPGVKTVAVQPLAAAALRDPSGAFRPDVLAAPTLDELLARSFDAPVLLGLVHADMHVLDLWASRDGAIGFRPGGAGRLGRADLPPGSWYLALANGLPAIVGMLRDEVYYVTNRAPVPATLSLVAREPPPGRPRVPRVTLTTSRRGQRLDLHLLVPTNSAAEPGHDVSLRLRLALDPRDVALLVGRQVVEMRR